MSCSLAYYDPERSSFIRFLRQYRYQVEIESRWLMMVES